MLIARNRTPANHLARLAGNSANPRQVNWQAGKPRRLRLTASGRRELSHHFLVDIEIRRNALHVIMVFEVFEQL
jgi:hypothetical protein